MPLGNWSVEWTTLNSQRRYPLAADASGRDESGDFELPTDLLVGLHLPVNAQAAIDPARFFLASLGAYAGGLALVVGYDAPGGVVPVASAWIPRSAHVKDAAYALGGIGAFAATRGVVAIGGFDSLDAQPPGLFTFEPAASRLDPDVVRPCLAGVDALYIVNGAEMLGPYTGDVVLRAGSNFQLTAEQADGVTTIYLHAIAGEGLVTGCECDGATAAYPPIRTVNGEGTINGHFALAGDECYGLAAAAGVLSLEDACSKPCCGCAELEKVTGDLQRMRQQQETLDKLVGELAAVVRETELVVLGARLGDGGCTQCP